MRVARSIHFWVISQEVPLPNCNIVAASRCLSWNETNFSDVPEKLSASLGDIAVQQLAER